MHGKWQETWGKGPGRYCQEQAPKALYPKCKNNSLASWILIVCTGTGKTLVARALAATASKAGTKVSFFMRKGADVLSKWVGEAERQLRLLFEEAQKAQPSIIFFDEIDGLAPVSAIPKTFAHLSPDH